MNLHMKRWLSFDVLVATPERPLILRLSFTHEVALRGRWPSLSSFISLPPQSVYTLVGDMPENMAAQCFKFNFALVSRIAESFSANSSFDLQQGAHVNIDKARREHEELVETLRRIGVDVIELPCDEKHPDGLFVDDIAVVINGTALVCNPPTIKDRPSRQGEVSDNFLCTVFVYILFNFHRSVVDCRVVTYPGSVAQFWVSLQ